MSDAIRAVDLVMNFRSVKVLNGLNLQVEQGSVFGLVGPNGAGKTTTIKVLMNLHHASRGHVEVLGVDSRALGPDDLAHIGYVSENQEMPDWMTVEYLLGYLKPFYPTWDDQRASELMKQFELPPTRKLKNLSRGMRMKAALASSLAYRPKLLVLDEPFSGLDPLVREDLIEGLLESAGETTIFVSSHDLGEIETFVSHIGYLDRGRLQFSEEMSSLSGRFREVEVTFENDVVMAQKVPANWTRIAATGPVLRFVDTQFDSEGTAAAVQQVYGAPKDISIAAMPLRSIFVAMARDAAKGK